jgi:hypothetical protein
VRHGATESRSYLRITCQPPELSASRNDLRVSARGTFGGGLGDVTNELGALRMCTGGFGEEIKGMASVCVDKTDRDAMA